jgi:hypothetical protein
MTIDHQLAALAQLHVAEIMKDAQQKRIVRAAKSAEK